MHAAPYTNVLLWLVYDTSLISSEVLLELRKKSNQLIVSVASIWEVQIKMEASARKQQEFYTADTAAFDLFITDTQQLATVTDIQLDHIRTMQHLPWHHRDPYDRIILATALTDHLRLISSDSIFRRYTSSGVDLWWPT